MSRERKKNKAEGKLITVQGKNTKRKNMDTAKKKRRRRKKIKEKPDSVEEKKKKKRN